MISEERLKEIIDCTEIAANRRVMQDEAMLLATELLAARKVVDAIKAHPGHPVMQPAEYVE